MCIVISVKGIAYVIFCYHDYVAVDIRLKADVLDARVERHVCGIRPLCSTNKNENI